jgi:hypothetical protein
MFICIYVYLYVYVCMRICSTLAWQCLLKAHNFVQNYMQILQASFLQTIYCIEQTLQAVPCHNLTIRQCLVTIIHNHSCANIHTETHHAYSHTHNLDVVMRVQDMQMMYGVLQTSLVVPPHKLAALESALGKILVCVCVCIYVCVSVCVYIYISHVDVPPHKLAALESALGKIRVCVCVCVCVYI